MSYAVEDVARLLDDSFQTDSSEDDTSFEVEESLIPSYIARTHQQNKMDKYYGACIRESGHYGTSREHILQLGK